MSQPWSVWKKCERERYVLLQGAGPLLDQPLCNR